MGRPRPFYPPGSGQPSFLLAALGAQRTEEPWPTLCTFGLRQGLWTVSNAKNIPSQLQIMRPRGQGTRSGSSQRGLLRLKAQGSFPASGSAHGSGPEVARHAFLSPNEGRHPCHPQLQESPSSIPIWKGTRIKTHLHHTRTDLSKQAPVGALVTLILRVLTGLLESKHHPSSPSPTSLWWAVRTQF